MQEVRSSIYDQARFWLHTGHNGHNWPECFQIEFGRPTGWVFISFTICFLGQITFNPQGSSVLTASADKTARLWDPETGNCKQVLEGHTDEIFSCAFNYEGNTIITGMLGFCVCVCVCV